MQITSVPLCKSVSFLFASQVITCLIMNACRKSGNTKETLFCTLCMSYLSHACHTPKEQGCESPLLQPEEQILPLPLSECRAEVSTGLCSLATHLTNRLARLGQMNKHGSRPVRAESREGGRGTGSAAEHGSTGHCESIRCWRVRGVCRSLQSKLQACSLQTFIAVLKITENQQSMKEYRFNEL